MHAVVDEYHMLRLKHTACFDSTQLQVSRNQLRGAHRYGRLRGPSFKLGFQFAFLRSASELPIAQHHSQRYPEHGNHRRPCPTPATQHPYPMARALMIG
jgi:hypothetical protein